MIYDVEVVVAATPSGGIGKNNNLPWPYLKDDMARFRAITCATRDPTKKNAVVMGRKTWDSIPAARRPLPGRINVVLSRNEQNARSESNIPEEALAAPSLHAALEALRCPSTSRYAAVVETVFVIGGKQAFEEALVDSKNSNKVRCSVLHLTRVLSPAQYTTAPDCCDVSLPCLAVDNFNKDDAFALVYLGGKIQQEQQQQPTSEASSGEASAAAATEPIEYQYLTYKNRSAFPILARSGAPTPAYAYDLGPAYPSTSTTSGTSTSSGTSTRHEEYQYLDAIKDIISTGLARDDRTGVGTIGKFGLQMQFNLRNQVFPLLTTKRVFWRGVAEELLWFVAGHTSAKLLQDKNIHIWDGNATKEFLEKQGITDREEGDLGPVYGFQWRHFGAEYSTMHGDYAGKGVDQLAEVIHKLKHNPTDRRIILTAWNPAALKKMALPPCHMFAQFYVAYPKGKDTRGELSCQMYQRSGDMGLGIPFNIASYSLLTRMIAQVCDLDAGEFIHVVGDAHVYSNHVEPLLTQLEREPRAFPTLTIDQNVKDIEGFLFEHFKIEGYQPHQAVKMEMAV